MSTNSRMGVLILAGTLSYALPAATEAEAPLNRLKDIASRYLEACTSPKKVRDLRKKLQQRVAQRLVDNRDLNEDSAMRSVMFDWAAGNETRLKNKDSRAVAQACVYLIAFVDKGYELPEQIRLRLTPEAVGDITQYMEDQIANAKEKGRRELTSTNPPPREHQ